MKYSVTILSLLLTTSSFAQRASFQLPLNFSVEASGENDTLGLAEFLIHSPTLYASPQGGYAFGNNWYGDEVKAQTFHLDSSQSSGLEGVLLWFGAVQQTSGYPDSSAIEVFALQNIGPGYLQSSFDSTAAPTFDTLIMAYAKMPMSSIDTGAFTFVDLSWIHANMPDTFTIAVRFSALLDGDTLGLVSTTDMVNGGRDLAWEANANGEWAKVSNSAVSWGLDVDLGIFPVMTEIFPSGIDEPEYSRVVAYPNPVEHGQIHLGSGLSGNFEITDPLGRLVQKGVVKNQEPINVEYLLPGMYHISVKVSNNRVARTKFMVVRP